MSRTYRVGGKRYPDSTDSEAFLYDVSDFGDGRNMRLSVIIPCFNEYATIDRIIDAVNLSPCGEKEIIIVDDCSRDGTREKLKSQIEWSGRVSRVIYHHVNQGKGAALRSGIAAAT